MKCIMQRFPVFIAENGSLRFSLLLMPPHATARAIHLLPGVSPFFPRVDRQPAQAFRKQIST